MSLLRVPTVAFLILFVLSLWAAYILFKTLKSEALIRQKGLQAGGALAGFILVLFCSWRLVRPALETPLPPPRLMPLQIPNGYKPVTLDQFGLALALPTDWEEPPTPFQVVFEDRGVNKSTKDKLDLLQVTSFPRHSGRCEDAGPPGNLKPFLSANFPFMKVVGPTETAMHQGRMGSVTPIEFTLQIAGETMHFGRLLMHAIEDEPLGRCVVAAYPDSELGRTIASTLNISPQLRVPSNYITGIVEEPLAVFAMLFLASLSASYLLFKVLRSEATVRYRRMRAGGAVAGFLVILYGSWSAVAPSLKINEEPTISPLSVPHGFKSHSFPEMEFAFAVPASWERSPGGPKYIAFSKKHPVVGQIGPNGFVGQSRTMGNLVAMMGTHGDRSAG